MSELLDRFSEAAAMVERDLLEGVDSSALGREGMTGEQVLRAMIVKQMNQYSYQRLAFHLEDSMSYRRFRGPRGDRAGTARGDGGPQGHHFACPNAPASRGIGASKVMTLRSPVPAQVAPAQVA